MSLLTIVHRIAYRGNDTCKRSAAADWFGSDDRLMRAAETRVRAITVASTPVSSISGESTPAKRRRCVDWSGTITTGISRRRESPGEHPEKRDLITSRGSVQRELRLFGLAYGLLGIGMLYAAGFVEPIGGWLQSARIGVGIAGVFLTTTACGVWGRWRWTPWMAAVTQSVILILVSAFFLSSLSGLRGVRLAWAVLLGIIGLPFYWSSTRFWLSSVVRGTFNAPSGRG